MDNQQLIQNYKQWLKGNGSADNTIKRYVRSVQHFTNFYEESMKKEINYQQVMPGDLQEWKSHMMQNLKYSDSTSNNYIKCIKAFFSFLIEIKAIQTSPAALLKPIKIQNMNKDKWLTEKEEVNLCFIVENSRNAWNNEWLFKRNRTAFYFMLKAGLRISEVCALDMADIQNGFIYVRHSKGQKTRRIYMSQDLAEIYVEYLPYREDRIKTGKVKETAAAALFFGERGNRLTVNGLAKVMIDLAQLINLADLTAHTLRHTFAHNLATTGASLTEIADILGHDTLQTTRIYITSSEKEQATAIERANNK